jgi:two-component system, OmpR family, sensor kinase
VSPASCTPFVARGTSCVFSRLSIRWRLALTSAALTFAILCAFAVAVGKLTQGRIRQDFRDQLATTSGDLLRQMVITVNADGGKPRVRPNLDIYAAPQRAAIRVLAFGGNELRATKHAPDFGFPVIGIHHVGEFFVATRITTLVASNGQPVGQVYVQYARKVSDLDATLARVRFFLLLGVLGGTGLALLAGLIIARRAMSPITRLTATAREIGLTGDLTQRVPSLDTDDEIAELASTLDDMLQTLQISRAQTEEMLERQRRFVADASHELRTPLTSVLANLELLADVLDGERGEAARSALRSSQRMRRLVSDLLLLARADASRTVARAPTDVGQVVVEAAAELEPVTNGHLLHIDAEHAVVDGARDELHRLALNLMENAIRHTPDGTQVRAGVVASNGSVCLTVEDDGPGIPAELRESLFERFVRGEGDRGGSFGLGLSIVKAVAESHGGTVTLEDGAFGRGARFVVTLPRAASAPSVDAGAPRLLHQ